MADPLLTKLNQGALWSKGLKKLDKSEDKAYIIHQTLMYGELGDVKNLFEVYGRKTVSDVFVKDPRAIYTPSAFNFVKNFILNLKVPLSERDYVKRGVVDR